MSVELLNQALLINRHIHGPEHISSAITLSQLSNAYRHLGDMDKSRSCAEEALQITQNSHGPLYPGIIIIINNYYTIYPVVYSTLIALDEHEIGMLSLSACMRTISPFFMNFTAKRFNKPIHPSFFSA